MSTTSLSSPISIGPCQIERLLGQGDMANIYRGFDPTLQRLVVIKLLSPSATALLWLVLATATANTVAAWNRDEFYDAGPFLHPAAGWVKARRVMPYDAPKLVLDGQPRRAQVRRNLHTTPVFRGSSVHARTCMTARSYAGGAIASSKRRTASR